MDTIKLKRAMVEFAKEMAKTKYPNEFVGLLRKDEDTIIEVLILPGSISGRGFSSYRLNMKPISLNSCGTIHSHPSRSNRPSKQDLRLFHRSGKYHIILSYPYNDENFALYNFEGDKLDFNIV